MSLFAVSNRMPCNTTFPCDTTCSAISSAENSTFCVIGAVSMIVMLIESPLVWRRSQRSPPPSGIIMVETDASDA